MTKLIILQNGLHGVYFMMNPVKSFLEKELGDDYDIKISNVNDAWRTWDGVAAGGKRLAEFVQDLCSKNNYTEISFVGHSLGGVYIRNCIGLLESENLFTKIKPKIYAAIASPHLGIVNLSRLKKLIASNCLGLTGLELLLEDKEQLFMKMAKSDSTYLVGLNRFEEKLIYGNLCGDRLVSLESSCICAKYPDQVEFQKLIDIDLEIAYNEVLPQKTGRLLDKLSRIAWTRRAIDLSNFIDVHNTIANKGWNTETTVLKNIVSYFK